MDLSNVPHKMQQFNRPERHMFAASEEFAMLKQAEATHSPDGRQFPVKPLIDIIEDIFQLASPSVPGFVQQGSTQAQLDLLDDKAFQSGFFDMLDLLSLTIKKVSCEISCKCSGRGDAHSTALGILNILASYTWDTKVVLAMVAFALNYGEFWVVAQLYPTNLLAKSVALLKQLPEILERADTLKSKFEALNSNLIKATLDVAKCILEFKDLPEKYITPDTPQMVTATAHFPTAVYWTIRSILACAGQIMGLVGMGHEYKVSTAESWELSNLAHNVNNIHTHLKDNLNLCYSIIDEKKRIEAYEELKRLMEKTHIDNMKVLRALIYAKDDQLPLVKVSTRTEQASLDVLRRKNVLLLISHPDVSLNYEPFIIKKMYQESRQPPTGTESLYEVVWMPVVDKTVPWTEENQKEFETQQGMMPWYSIHHPSMVDPTVISYIKEFWNFEKKPILVVLDPQGNVVNTNALHMMWIWGSFAFPFTDTREEDLWREEACGLNLLADSIDSAIPAWIEEKKFVCLYGGDDMDWIRKFTKAAKTVAGNAGITLEMLYVGKSNPKEKVRRNMVNIEEKNLSHTLQDISLIRFFWVRLENMLHSKIKHGNNPIMKEIMKILSYDKNNLGWAVICRGSESGMARSKGETILTCFDQYDMWNPLVEHNGFIGAMNLHLQQLFGPEHHCIDLEMSESMTESTIPESMPCDECGKPMEMFIKYHS